VLCPIHAESLKREVTSTAGVLTILLAERAMAQAMNAPEDFFDEPTIEEWKRLRWADGLSREDALTQLTHAPFHWQPLEVCWHTLTGQPLPSARG